MNSPKITVEQALHFLALLVAAGIRFIELGTVALTEREAAVALQAWEIARGSSALPIASPGYSLATGLLFELGSSETLARILPALAGVLLVGLPYAFRKLLGRPAALILAFGLAVDPGLVAVSRQAGGVMFAAAFGGAALAAWRARRAVITGIFAGFALLSGPAILGGTLVLAAAAGLARLAGVSLDHEPLGNLEISGDNAVPQSPLRVGILSGGATLLLAGTLFLRYPQGIAALTGSLPIFIGGWVVSSELPLLRQLIVLIFYHPLPLTFGAMAAFRAWREDGPAARVLGLWAGVAVLFALVYPGRQVSDLVWALLPLWALASMELARYARWPVQETSVGRASPHDQQRTSLEESWTALALAAIIFVFLAYVWLNLLSLARLPDDPELTVLRWVLIGGALLLGVLASGLISLGWGRKVASHGLTWGVAAGLAAYMLAATWQSVDPAVQRSQEMWWQQPATVGQEMLLDTMYGISEWHTGRTTAIPVTVLVDLSALRWGLRQFPEARFVERLAADTLPELVITARDIEPRLAASYRGTDIGWSAGADWAGAVPPEFLKWLMFRNAPEAMNEIILWARNDLFLDGGPQAPEEDPTAGQNTTELDLQDADGAVQ